MYDERELVARLKDALRRVANLERQEFAAGGPGAGLTFENGLTRLLDTIRLGGLLTQDTVIDGDQLRDLSIIGIASLLYLQSEGDITLDASGGITLDSDGELSLISGSGDVIIRSDSAGQVVRLLTQALTRLFADDEGNVVVGPSTGDGTLATNATDGFLHIPFSAGPPTGTPTAFTGRAPLHYDATNEIFYIYDGAWIPINPNIGARVYNSANLSINSGAVTLLTYNSERWDTAALHSTVSNTGRLTAPVKGRYLITTYVRWAANAIGTRRVLVRLNGGTDYADDQLQAVAVAGENTQQVVSTVIDMSAGDYAECLVYHTAGVAINVQAAGNVSPEFSMELLTRHP